MINFLDDILGLDGYSCADSDVFPIFESAKFIIRIIQIAVPFGLILWGSIDWFKALIAHDEKEMRMKRKPFLARVIAALIVLVLPWIVTAISNVVAGKTNTVNFWTCYHEATPRIDFSKWQNTSDGGGGVIGGFNGNGPTGGATPSSSSNNGSGGSSSGDSGYTAPSGGSNYDAPSRTVKDKCSDFEKDGSTEAEKEKACNNGSTSKYKCEYHMGHCTEVKIWDYYKQSCSEFNTYNSCESGETETHTCQWVYEFEKCTEKAPKSN